GCGLFHDKTNRAAARDNRSAKNSGFQLDQQTGKFTAKDITIDTDKVKNSDTVLYSLLWRSTTLEALTSNTRKTLYKLFTFTPSDETPQEWIDELTSHGEI